MPSATPSAYEVKAYWVKEHELVQRVFDAWNASSCALTQNVLTSIGALRLQFEVMTTNAGIFPNGMSDKELLESLRRVGD